MSLILVTGATGVVGSALVPRLLDLPEARPVLVVRARSQEHLEQRTAELIDFWRPAVADPSVLSRITAVRGDVTAPRFGLEGGMYQELVETVTHIVHCAADVRMNRPIDQARAVAVGSAKNLLSFAAACRSGGRLSKVEFVSTVGVAGRLEVAPERRIVEPRSYRNTYEQAKAEAEELVFQAIADGLPITVHRPSMVVGDSRTGRIIRFQVFYFLCDFLAGIHTRGFVPRVPGVRLDTIPCDTVARAICWSSQTRSAEGAVLHLCSGPERSITIGALAAAVRGAMLRSGRTLPPVREVPLILLVAAVAALRTLTRGRARRVLGSLPMFLAYARDRQEFDNSLTLERLSRAGVEVPRIEDYLEPVLTYAREHRDRPSR